MGNHYRQTYLKSVSEGSPTFWAAPPANIIASDLGETLVHAIFAGSGAWLLSGGIQYLSSSGDLDMMRCAAWAGIAAGSVMLAPILSNVASDFACDIREGWNRGAAPEMPEPEPVTQVREIELSEEEEGAARIPGEWWYRNLAGEIRCYHTPTAKATGTEKPKPILSDKVMIAIFSEVARGTPFSERRMCDKIGTALSGPRFRLLQDDWTNPGRQLYVIRPGGKGYFTQSGKLIIEAIRSTQL